MGKITKIILICLVIWILAFNSCQFFQKTYFYDEVERFEPNLSQERLYDVWASYYFDYLESIKKQKTLKKVYNGFSNKIEEQRMIELTHESLSRNQVPISDSLSKKGVWRFCNKNWLGKIDTLIQIEINCVLGKMVKDEHSIWIVKKVETRKKNISQLNVSIHPFFEYNIDDNNNIVTELLLQLHTKENYERYFEINLLFFRYRENYGKSKSFFTIFRATLGEEETDSNKMICYDNSKSGLSSLLHYYKNGYIETEGDFFNMCR